MKRLFTFFMASLCLACSSPKYSYHFDHYDYNSGRKSSTDQTQKPQRETLALQPALLEANLSKGSIVGQELERGNSNAAPAHKEAAKEKAEQKELRKELKKEIRTYIKTVKKVDTVKGATATKVMDGDLKLAIIFGAVGLVLTLFGGVSSAFWVLGVIAIVVGVVFLIKWLVRQ